MQADWEMADETRPRNGALEFRVPGSTFSDNSEPGTRNPPARPKPLRRGEGPELGSAQVDR